MNGEKKHGLNKKRFLAAVIALCCIAGVASAIGVRSSASPTAGKCGEDIIFTFGDGNQLFISGTGEMYDFPFVSIDNSSIETVFIDSGVTSIGKGAFSGFSNLISIDIPESVTKIGENAFEDCATLSGIRIPAGVSLIGNNAFPGCSNLEYITVDTDNDVYCDINGILFSKDGTRLIRYPEGNSSASYHFSIDITTIENYAFQGCTNLWNADFYDCTALTTIGDYAFQGCTNLEYADFINCITLTTIGDHAFQGCTNLSDAHFFDSTALTTIGDYAFQGCTNLENAQFNHCTTLTTIGNYAFQGCTNLSGAHFIDCAALTTIGDYAFQGCTNLSDDHFYDGTALTTIGDYAFQGCTGLFNADFNNCTALTTIGNYAFQGCTNLSDAHFFDSTALTTIGDYAFQGCTGLFNADFNNCTALTTIGDYAFQGCTNLSDAHFFDSTALTNIGDYAFQGCTNLSDAHFYGCTALTNIGDYAFQGCTNLRDTNFYDCTALTTIGDYAFQGCTNLEGAYYDDCIALTTIGNYAFAGCTALMDTEHSPLIPDSVTSIGENAFNGVNNIRYSENMKASGSPWGAKTVNGYEEDGIIYSNPGKTFVTGCCSNLVGEITLPDTVKGIGDYAFDGCKDLSITIPTTVTRIGTEAFRNAMNISYRESWYEGTMKGKGSPWGAKAVNLTIEGNFAYSDAGKENLVDCFPTAEGQVEVPETVKTVADYTFSGCNAITSLDFTSSEIVFEDYALAGCENLTEVNSANTEDDVTFTVKPPVIRAKALRLAKAGADYTDDGIGILFCNRSCGKNEEDKIYYIPYFVEYICENAFANCKYVKVSFENGSRIRKIGANAFINSKDYNECNENVLIIDGYLMQVKGNLNGKYIIPEDVNLVANAAFARTGITEFGITEDSQLRNIGKSAFADCRRLGSITLPAYTHEIGESCFENCTALTEISFSGNMLDGDSGTPAKLGNKAFCNCGLVGRIDTDWLRRNWKTLQNAGSVIGDEVFHIHTDKNGDGRCDTCDSVINQEIFTALLPKNFSLNVPEGKTVNWRNIVSFTVTAKNLPKGYKVIILDGDTEIARSGKDESSVSYKSGELRDKKTYSVKIETGNGYSALDSNGNELEAKKITVEVNDGFFKKVIAFFRQIFGGQPIVNL